MVASLAEAWIETAKLLMIGLPLIVASLAEAWIETQQSMAAGCTCGRSPPSRRRGRVKSNDNVTERPPLVQMIMLLKVL